MKLRASTKILFGFAGLVALAYGANFAYTKISLGSTNLNPVPTGDVCLIALGKDAGVRDIVANHMVQIVESSSGSFNAGSDAGGDRQGSVKKRIPVRELIEILNGEVDSVEAFLRKMRSSSEDLESTGDGPIWTRADIEKAMGGDAALKTKLENDLNIGVDGTPLPSLNRTAFFDGIRIKIPVTLAVPNAKGPTLEAFDVVNFKPKVISRFYKSMREKFYDKAQLQEYYAAFLKDDDQKKEDLGATFSAMFQRAQNSEELAKAKKIAENTKILVSQSMITSAEVLKDAERDGQSKDLSFSLKLHLTPEGKNRLWKFSSEGGNRIILVSKGVAIASATIGTQLNSEELVIKQIADETLLTDAVSLIHPKN